MRDSPPTASPTPIRFSGRLDEALYRRAARLALRGVLPIGFIWTLVGGALGVGVVLAFGLGQLSAGALAFSLGLLGLFALLLHEAAARRAWRVHGRGHEPVEGAFDEEALHLYQGAHGRSEIPWDRVQRWKAARGLLLVYASPRVFQVVAADFFATPDDWRAALALVARKVPSSQRDDRRRLVWIFLASFLLFLAATIAWTAWRAP